MLTKDFPGRVAVMGGGSWATALAKLLLRNRDTILWYMRRDDRIEEFVREGHNPAYLTDVQFDVQRIEFSSDINYVAQEADTLLLVMPSPYFKSHLEKLTVDISKKFVVSAVKGIVPGENMLVTDYMRDTFHVADDHLLVVSGPCHAEEVALDRPTYLTIACKDIEAAKRFGRCVCGSKNCHAIPTTDVDGVEYAGVLKNVYAIAAGIVPGMKKGDNIFAKLLRKAIREMEQFFDAVFSISACSGFVGRVCLSSSADRQSCMGIAGRSYRSGNCSRGKGLRGTGAWHGARVDILRAICGHLPPCRLFLDKSTAHGPQAFYEIEEYGYRAYKG